MARHGIKCSICGAHYHESDGGCGCTDNLMCQCGCREWERGANDELFCNWCHTGPFQEGKSHRSVHVARKTHSTKYGEPILPGDKYARIVTFGYYPGGAFSMKIINHIINKGPAWAVVEVMES